MKTAYLYVDDIEKIEQLGGFGATVKSPTRFMLWRTIEDVSSTGNLDLVWVEVSYTNEMPEQPNMKINLDSPVVFCEEITLQKYVNVDVIKLHAAKQNHYQNAGTWCMFNKEHREFFKKYMRESQYALYWVRRIEPKDAPFCVQFIDNAKDAYDFVCIFPEYEYNLIDLVDDEIVAYKWALRFPHSRCKLINIIKSSEYAFFLAYTFEEDRSNVIHLIEAKHVPDWLYQWPDDMRYFIDTGVINDIPH